MARQLSKSQLAQFQAQALADPQVPRPNPTISFWQLPPHPTVSEIRSAELPRIADYVVIGSGVTGCSVAKTLLENSPSSATVTVIEARTLTSGATGRNGGLLSSFVPNDYKTISDRFGHEQATKIARFANRTLDKMHALGNSSEELKDASEVRRLIDVISFETDEAFNEAVESFRLYEEHVPEDKGKTEILTREEAASRYNMNAKAGAIVFPNGALWPYRLITGVWAQLCAENPSRLSIETNTPVVEMEFDPNTASTHPYLLHTPRGTVRASQVIHATNGFAGHLVPGIRGKIYPLRGHMSTQKATVEFGRLGHELSWSVADSSKFDDTTGTLEPMVYYSNQNPKTGDIFIGGEKVPLDKIIVSDDTQVTGSCAENLSTLLPKIFLRGWKTGEKPEVKRIWSGIMGFTADSVPLVGRLPQSATHRGEGEWIAAGFNGYGMPLCWSSGEAVAKMVLGLDVSDFLPEVFLITEKRLNQDMQTAEAIKLILG